MKLNFFKSVGRMGRKSLPLLICLMLSPFLARGSDPSHNTGIIAYYSDIYADTVSYPPNVNSVNFYNSGVWDIFTEFPLQDYALGVQLPYATANTLNFTNKGTMTGSVGWEFDYGQTTIGTSNPSGRGMAGMFYNVGTIESVNGNILPLANSQYPSLASFLTISATNVINLGNLIGGVAGNVEINGVNVSLAGGVVQIAPDGCIPSQCSDNNFDQTNFTADTAIYDEYWGTNSLNLVSSNLWNGASVTTPYFVVDEPCQQFNVVILPNTVYPTLADSITNIGAYTNIITTNMDGVTAVTNREPSKIFKQAVFVGTSDYRIIPADRFYDVNSTYGHDRSNLFQTITVRLTSYSGCTLYLVDTLGSSTNHEFLPNATVIPGSDPRHPLCNDTTFRPGNYILERTDCQLPPTFASGSPGFGPPDTNFFYDSSYSNAIVPAFYSAYSGYADDVVRTQPPNAANTLTNSPGRIVVTASNLDLTYATLISGGPQISLKANNFTGSSDAIIQCRNVSYNLGSTSGNLNIVNLATNTPVPGLHGYVDAWGALWTNSAITGVFTNYSIVTNTVGTNIVSSLTNNVITNLAEVDLNVLVVDARPLIATEYEKVEDLILHSTNMIVNDSANVQNDLLFDGTSLTLNGSLGLSPTNLPNWDSSIAPSLLYFTNNGTLTVPQDAHFGDDTPTSYAAFVNNGTISVGGGEIIDSVYYQSSGQETAPGGYSVTTVTGKVENASITSGGDVSFSGGSLKLDHSTLSAGNVSQLSFDLTNALYDSGGSANNTLTCGYGFSLPAKPAFGDLLGTTINWNAGLVFVSSVWAGTDYGSATTAGYTNNEAIGQLILSPDSSSLNPTRFSFGGTGSGNALYVDMLDLSQISSNNLSAALQMNNITVYYAAAKLSFTPPPLNGVSQEPEEYLNGMFNGHLRWVTNFAGPNSSVDVIINGQTYAVNRALRYSKIIDSNGNGIPNYYDANPFNTPPSGSVPQLALTVSLVPQPGQSSTNTAQTESLPSTPPVVALSWVADPNAGYQVQYRANLSSGVWLPLLNYTNTASTNVNVTVWDTNTVAGQRFYRLSRP